jgi:tetratricopeptide (TPR) repeat protein
MGFTSLSPEEKKHNVELVLGSIKLTRNVINARLEGARAADAMDHMLVYSEPHYSVESEAIFELSGFYLPESDEEAERYLAMFEKRVEEIETIRKRKKWNLEPVRFTKERLLAVKCNLYERQGREALALETLSKALEKDGEPMGNLRSVYATMCLKSGRIEESLKSMETVFSMVRGSNEHKELIAELFNSFLRVVPEESKPLFQELIPQYPHVLWAASSAGYVELSDEEKKALRSNLAMKKVLYCVNCSKELTKVYRCSRCDIATYCGSTCQKEAWKEHKKICKKRE